MSFDVVVAADLDWGIGKHNALPWPKLRGDMAHFRRITSTAPEGQRNAIVMGRKTWESAEVAGRPLPNRLNIVITRRDIVVPAGVGVANSFDAALALAREASTTFVVGGAEIFREAFVHAALRFVYLTRIDGRFDCDTTLPDLDRAFTRDAGDGEQALEDNGVRYRIERLISRSAVGSRAADPA